MIYKDFQNLRLPMLGFGSMRLPLLPGGGDGDVDEAAVAEMVALAMERGANYFDTAYGYHNGNSERVMGRVLSRYPRESWLLASKFPGYDVSNIRPDRVEAIFEEQLEKCGVDYFDFYLFHNVYERNVGPYLDPDNRVLEYLLRQKEAGRIRHLGFSAHGSLAVIQRFLDAYGEYMEFGQLQLNYLDWDFQGARAKAEELNRRHIPIWVMEPLRGGRLARLSDGDAARLAVLRPEESMPGWAFRFLQGVPGVTMVLSGMSSLEQLRANLDTFETDRPLSEAEKAALLDVAAGMVREQVLPCTACRYCVDHCPRHLDIPGLLARAFSSPGVGCFALAGVVGCISYRCWYKAMNMAGVSRAMALNITYALWGVLFGALFTDVEITRSLVIGAAAIFAGMFLVIGNPRDIINLRNVSS